jgi:hypothetical protein
MVFNTRWSLTHVCQTSFSVQTNNIVCINQTIIPKLLLSCIKYSSPTSNGSLKYIMIHITSHAVSFSKLIITRTQFLTRSFPVLRGIWLGFILLRYILTCALSLYLFFLVCVNSIVSCRLCQLSHKTQAAEASKYMCACMGANVRALFIKNNMIDVQFIFNT